jgi:hypothetical protein
MGNECQELHTQAAHKALRTLVSTKVQVARHMDGGNTEMSKPQTCFLSSKWLHFHGRRY